MNDCLSPTRPSMNESAVTDHRAIRVFLSCTFRDSDDERSYLLQHVFPRGRQDCAQRSVGFIEIGLRLGVIEQASQNCLTVERCLSEIERSRQAPPFVIGFLLTCRAGRVEIEQSGCRLIPAHQSNDQFHKKDFRGKQFQEEI